MGWSKAGRPDSVPCSIPPKPLGSQEEGLAGRQMVSWEEGLPSRRTTVRTDGGLGRGPELAHLLLPLQGLFSAPLTELEWVHSKSLWMLCRPWLSAGVPAQFPLGGRTAPPSSPAGPGLSAGGDLGEAPTERPGTPQDEASVEDECL